MSRLVYSVTLIACVNVPTVYINVMPMFFFLFQEREGLWIFNKDCSLWRSEAENDHPCPEMDPDRVQWHSHMAPFQTILQEQQPGTLQPQAGEAKTETAGESRDISKEGYKTSPTPKSARDSGSDRQGIGEWEERGGATKHVGEGMKEFLSALSILKKSLAVAPRL